jgi:riboflavin synthase
MFTGIIVAVGTVTERAEVEGAVDFAVRAEGFAEGLTEGESVAVDGVCVTVTPSGGPDFRFPSVLTTLRRTTFGEIAVGRRVNLERALRAGDPLGGHLVQGHVDGVGEVREVERLGETVLVRIVLPPEIAALTVARGSLAVDGVSLTVAGLTGEVAEIALIPYTWTHTALDRLQRGDRVNLEADLIGKYVERLLEPYATEGGSA